MSYNSDILTDSKSNFIYNKKKIGEEFYFDIALKTDKNTNILALNNKLNSLKYIVDISILDYELFINTIYLEAMELGLTVNSIDIFKENGVIVINEKLEGEEQDD